MRTILYFTCLLAGFFAATITVTLIAAHRLDVSPALNLPLSDCQLPCFAGAVIEQTKVDEAISQMAKRFEPHGYVFIRRVWSSNTIAVTWAKTNVSNINVTFTGEMLTSIGMGIDPNDKNMPHLGGLVATLGHPSCVLTNRNQFYNVYYLDRRYVMTIGVNALKLDQRIQWITVETLPKPSKNLSNPNCATIAAQDWRGFTGAKNP